MNSKKLFLPFFSLLLCVLIAVPSAILYQNIKQAFAPKIYILPSIKWDQGMRSAMLQADQIELPKIQLTEITDEVTFKHSAIKKTKISKRKSAPKFKRLTYATLASNPAAEKIQASSLTIKAVEAAVSPGPRVEVSVNNKQLLRHSGFTWKLQHSPSLNLLALLEQLKIESAMLALQAKRIAEENQQRLAVVKEEEKAPVPPPAPEILPDTISTVQSAAVKEYKELVVESDLDSQSSETIPSYPSTNDEPMVTALPEAPVVPVPASEVIASPVVTSETQEQASIWPEWQDRPVSSGVALAIASAKKKMSSQIEPGAAKARSKFDYSKRLAMVTTQIDRAQLDEQGIDQSLMQVQIQATEVEIGKGFDRMITHFDFAPAYAGIDERISDDQGIILLENMLANDQGILSGSLLKDGYLPLKIDLALDKENELTEINLPLIQTAQFISFLEKQNLMGEGAHFLAEVAEGIVDVEIDQSYESKMYLSSDFKVVKEGEAFSFVLIVGAKSGNALLSYLFEDGDTAERLIHLPEGQIAYDYAQMRSKRTSRFKLNQQLPLATKPMPFDTNERYVGLFNSEVHSSQQAPGVYDLKLPTHPVAHRQYLELKHIEGSLFVGINGDATIDVPSDHLFAEVFNNFSLPSLEGICMIQLNLGKQAYKITYAGESKDHGMQVRSLYLEKNGKFEAELSPISKKGFLVGEEQGVINVKIDYLDDSTEYLQTFCSPNTYLIEQL